MADYPITRSPNHQYRSSILALPVIMGRQPSVTHAHASHRSRLRHGGGPLHPAPHGLPRDDVLLLWAVLPRTVPIESRRDPEAHAATVGGRPRRHLHLPDAPRGAPEGPWRMSVLRDGARAGHRHPRR